MFGEVSSPARRSHLKDDFFSDIFQSSVQSACSSPRRGDPLNSPSPGSRILSPTRPLPPIRGEAVGGGSSLPAQLSLSTKLAKATDRMMTSPTQLALYRNEEGSTDTFPPSPTASAPSYTTRAVTAQDDLKNDANVLYRQSPLSRQVSHSLDKSSGVMDSTSLSIKSYPQKDSTSLESYINKGQFHFSIYKWAGKGVTLIMPPKSNLQHDSRFKTLPEIVVQQVDVILHGDNVPTLTTAGKSQGDNLKSVMDVTVETQVDADSTTAKKPAEFESKFHHSVGTEKSDICNSNTEEVPVTIHESQKHELKNLKQLFDDNLKKQQEIIRQVEGTGDFSRGQQTVHANVNIKQQAGRENKKNNVKVTSPNTRDAAVSPGEKVVGSKVKGKVKDFIKIFNQEGSPKRKGANETPGRRSRGKDEGKGKVQEPVFFSTPKAYEQVKTTSESCNSTLSDPPVQRNEDSEMAEKVNFDISFDVHMADDSLSERKDPLTPGSDSTPDIIDASVYDVEESHFEDLEGFLVEPLSQDQNNDPKIDSDQDQIKSIDAKIREWSKGKEGNIRSLLSTLQYVLWPESGWKPIPLVDIIEGASVKRAYQKALLRLHPDKLQQKGIAPHQKYIAEKVFDIMQEAWDHFNSISEIY